MKNKICLFADRQNQLLLTHFFYSEHIRVNCLHSFRLVQKQAQAGLLDILYFDVDYYDQYYSNIWVDLKLLFKQVPYTIALSVEAGKKLPCLSLGAYSFLKIPFESGDIRNCFPKVIDR